MGVFRDWGWMLFLGDATAVVGVGFLSYVFYALIVQ
jgi:hypothetical protein